MNRFLVKFISALLLLSAVCSTASAEVVKGKLKGVAGESKQFTLMVDQEKVLLVSWDNRTEWLGVSKATELKFNEILTVNLRTSGDDNAVAASIARIKTPIPKGVKVLSLEKLVQDLSAPGGGLKPVLVDTRPAELYDAGHIPGAISAPFSRLEKRTYGILPEEKGARLVFYDQGQGGDSAGKSAEISSRSGYADVAVLPDGASGWVDSGRFLASSSVFIRKVKPVVIDLRSSEQVAQGHIEGAVNYPAPLLKSFYGYLPLERRVPIVVYGDTDKEVVAGAELILGWGYRNVTIYPGGTDAWLKSAEVLKTGPAEEKIYAAVASHGGKLQAKDFDSALHSPVMVEIVDVRTEAEQKKTGFPKSKKIPLHDIVKRHGELDREKIQVVFAGDSVRAEMAYDFLKSKGYRINYLDGAVEFDEDGKYSVK